MPRGLELFCSQGGSAEGYRRAGFEMVGVDIEPQPRFPFHFIQADALEYVKAHGHEYDFIAASPPCHAHTPLRHRTGKTYLDLIPDTRVALEATGLPYIIENVMGATLRDPLVLCGSMFGLGSGGRVLRRHRKFESNVELTAPGPDACRGRKVGGVYGTGGGGQMTRGYKFHPGEAREAMGIDWMSKAGLSQAIPPAYTEYLGKQLLAHV